MTHVVGKDAQGTSGGTCRTVTIPRVLIASPSSGSGKTTVTCGLIRALEKRGHDVVSFKCGPDYIDPMFHRVVSGTICRNLDLFFSSEDEARAMLAQGAHGHDVAVLEGVMGYYDGIGGTTTDASTYHVARATGTPTILVVDGRNTPLSLSASICGLRDFREDSNIAGIILNRCPDRLYNYLAAAIENECAIPVIGYLSDSKVFSLESRHLGLVTSYEIKDLGMQLDCLASIISKTVDLDKVLEIAGSAPAVEYEPTETTPVVESAPTIAVARDEAFCFYYDENLEMLQQLGAGIVEFSPLRDSVLPAEADALYLGGGYPELYAEMLSENTTMLESVRAAHESGMPIFAECGGFLYLKEQLKDKERKTWPLVGALPGRSRYTGKLTRFGYVELTARCDGLGIRMGETLRAHEFHYYDSDDNGTAFSAVKPVTGKSWECGIVGPSLVAGFPHLYFPSCPQFAERFVKAAEAYHRVRGEKK